MARRKKGITEVALPEYIDRIKQACHETGKYSAADDLIIEHAALILMYIDQARQQVVTEGLVQTFKTGAKNISPEINNLRGLLKDFRDYCDDLGLSPAARKRLEIQLEEKPKYSAILTLLNGPNKAANE